MIHNDEKGVIKDSVLVKTEDVDTVIIILKGHCPGQEDAHVSDSVGWSDSLECGLWLLHFETNTREEHDVIVDLLYEKGLVATLK